MSEEIIDTAYSAASGMFEVVTPKRGECKYDYMGLLILLFYLVVFCACYGTLLSFE